MSLWSTREGVRCHKKADTRNGLDCAGGSGFPISEYERRDVHLVESETLQGLGLLH